jgi:chaperone required for assembly of F1-ATPase
VNWAVKRFYTAVDVRAVEDGFAITLDGRIIKTPGGARLVVPTHDLAGAIAGEWAAQEKNIKPDTMPLARLAIAAIDQVRPDRQAIVDRLLGYVGTDLVCYRAESPADLAIRQEAAWRPLLVWANAACGASFIVTTGVMPVSQPPATRLALQAAMEPFDDMEIAALASATAVTGSLVIALALAAGCVDAEEAFAAAMVDELFQVERWGEDAEAMARRQILRREIQAAARFFDLVR